MFTEALSSLKTRSPLRVFSVFAAGIVLPGIFLSYLGVRSMYYENKLLQRQAEDQYAAVANLMQKKAGDQILALVASVGELGREPPIQQFNVTEMTRYVLSTKKAGELPLNALYVFDEQDRMLAPWTSESSALPDAGTVSGVDWGTLKPDIDRLEHLEFVDKDTAGAVKGYQTLQSPNLPVLLQAALLKAAAAGYRKMSQNAQAEASYLKLARNYDQVLDASGLPMGVLACQMLMRLYDQEQAFDQSLDVQLDLWEGLLLHRWKLPRDESVRMTKDLEASITNLFSAHPGIARTRRQRWEQLQQLRKELEDARSASQSFAKAVWPSLLTRLGARGWQESGGVLRLSPTSPISGVAVVAPIINHDSVHRHGWLVALIPGQELWTPITQLLTELAQPVGLQVRGDNLGLTNPITQSTHAFWKPEIERQIATIDPPLTFKLFDTTVQEKDRLSRRRRWIYGGIIGLSLIVIMVGLWVMRQAIKREMEVADLKADFVANVSHELRTPLAAISHIGERLSLGRVRSEDERNEFYGMLGEETRHLRGLVEDILDFSKVLAGKKEYRHEPANLAVIVQEAYERFRSKAEGRGFDLRMNLPQTPIEILGDSRALVQAILNLLDNALKYSGESRRIELKLSVSGSQAIVTVLDYGIGIPKDEKDRIFEKFYRVENPIARDTQGGVGLGLAMVKHIVEGHKGSIHVETTLGKGSCFSISFQMTSPIAP